jgi:hypothetical protein
VKNVREALSFVDAREAARLYISLGWYPIPLHPDTKKCRDDDWQKRGQLGERPDYVPEDFQPGDNVGIRLISAKDQYHTLKLVGVDLDCEEAVTAAKSFLPDSMAAWGRKSKAISQVLYVSEFEESIAHADQAAGKKMLCELRVDHQSMAPPSRHPNGEQLRWLSDRLEPATIAAKDLQRSLALIATTAMVARYYNPPGARHEWCMAFSGFLRQLGLTEDEAVKVITCGANIAGDSKVPDRVTEVRTTYARHDSEPTSGAKRLIEMLGKVGALIVNTIRDSWGVSAAWVTGGEKGKIVANSQENIRRALKLLEIQVCEDKFANRFLIQQGEFPKHQLDDSTMDRLWLEIEKRYGFRPTRDYFDVVVNDTARKAPFHPVRDYLNSLKWDGVKRLDGWLHTYGKAADNPYTQAVGAILLIAAVRRVMTDSPAGVKFDELLVLESPQGWNKSTALRTLCPKDEWFSDDLPLNVDAKQLIERTAGKWIIEAAELSGMRKSQAEQLKATLSRQVDGPVRLAYARRAIEIPRQFVVVGTTNAQSYLKDTTGNRRFWPVKVERFDIEKLAEDRDQLWAEAAEREAQNESIRLPVTLYSIAGTQQERRRSEDPWEPLIQQHMDNLPTTSVGQRVLPQRLWEIVEIPTAQQTEFHQERINGIMQRLGFRRCSIREGTKVTKGWGRNLVDGLWKPAGWEKTSE